MANPNRSVGAREVYFTVILLVVATLLFVYFSNNLSLRREKELEGKLAPEIEFEMPNSRKPSSITKQKGKVVLLNFWASWCTPCIEEMPALKMLENHFRGKGFVLFAFNVEDESENIRGRLTGRDYPENLIFNFRKEFLRPYDLRAIPVSVLIDSKGIVRHVYSGPRNWMDIHIIKEIELLLR